MMNWKRGLFRLWLVGSVIWIALGLYLFSDKFTAMRDVEVEPMDFICRPSPCPPNIVNKYACLLYRDSDGRRSCTYEYLSYRAADQRTRTWAVVGLIAPPIAVPLLGFLVFWAGWIATVVGKWIVRGFGPPTDRQAGPIVNRQSKISQPQSEREDPQVVPPSLLLPIGKTPWVIAVLGFGMGVDKASEIVQQDGIYGTGMGDLIMLSGGAANGIALACIFVAGRAAWRWMRR